MIDVLAVLLLAYLLFRGWTRGFVREAMDLAGLILAILLAFRLAPFFGGALGALFGLSDAAARLVGGILVFFGAGLGAGFAARAIERKFGLPGLNLANRAGGAGLGAVWGVFVATLVLTLGVVLPVPPAVADQLDDSAVARTLTDPGGVPQEVFSSLSGDRIVEALLNLRRFVGERRVIIQPGDTVEIPPADPADLERDQRAARQIFDLVNRDRIAAGEEPLAWSDDLAEVASGHAFEMYVEGYFAHESPTTGDVAARLRKASIDYRAAGENLALAATPPEVHRGLMDSPGHRANILATAFRRVGIAVWRGPLGLMTVQVFTD